VAPGEAEHDGHRQHEQRHEEQAGAVEPQPLHPGAADHPSRARRRRGPAGAVRGGRGATTPGPCWPAAAAPSRPRTSSAGASSDCPGRPARPPPPASSAPARPARRERPRQRTTTRSSQAGNSRRRPATRPGGPPQLRTMPVPSPEVEKAASAAE
jgi:hypothetical protein